MINWAKVLELRDEVGLEDFDEVVDLFLDEVEDTIMHLGTPGRSLEHDLHFLKGSALNLGFSEFSELCRSGESEAARGLGHEVDTGRIIACYHSSKATFLSDAPHRLAS
jgi:HPt (histidine-containing phosphotransfer) domain-containing protein